MSKELQALQAVLELHQPVEVEPSETICAECSFRLPNGRYFDNHPDLAPAAVRATAIYLHNRADQLYW